MAVTLNATSGSSTANSYVTLAEASSYFEPTAFSATWEGLSTPQKVNALVEAARDLEATYSFIYDRATSAQALEFPRSYVEPSIPLDGGSIPIALKRAQLEMARLNLESSASGEQSDDRDIEKVDVAGVVSITYSQSPAAASQVARSGGTLERVANLVRPLLGGGGGPNTVRLRKGF